MKRAVFYILIIISVMTLLSRCQCCEGTEPYEDISAISAAFYNTGDSLVKDSIYSMDTLVVKMRSNIIFVSQNISFISGAYASSGCRFGEDGKKYDITDLYITSKFDYNDSLRAGSNLNDIVLCKSESMSYNGYDSLRSIQSFLDSAKSFQYLTPFYEISFYFLIKPNISKMHQFTIQMKKGNGAGLFTQTDSIIWQ